MPRGKEAPHGEVAIQRPNDDDPPIGGDTHIGDVLGMSVVEAPEHLPVRAERRIEFTGGERVSSPRRRGPPSGPRNSIATAVPSGIRSIADRKVTVTRPVATPRASTEPASERVRSRRRGRLIARKTIAPAVRRSHAVPAGPTIVNRCVDRADPAWTESIATTARVHAGTRSESPP